MSDSRHGKHADADKHRRDALARYHALKHDPLFKLRRRETVRRYRQKWYTKARETAGEQREGGQAA